MNLWCSFQDNVICSSARQRASAATRSQESRQSRRTGVHPVGPHQPRWARGFRKAPEEGWAGLGKLCSRQRETLWKRWGGKGLVCSSAQQLDGRCMEGGGGGSEGKSGHIPQGRGWGHYDGSEGGPPGGGCRRTCVRPQASHFTLWVSPYLFSGNKEWSIRKKMWEDIKHYQYQEREMTTLQIIQTSKG